MWTGLIHWNEWEYLQQPELSVGCVMNLCKCSLIILWWEWPHVYVVAIVTGRPAQRS